MALSTRDFVLAMYRGILGREPDAAGFDGWVARLGDEMAPAEAVAAMQGFVRSDEFRSRRVFMEDFGLAGRGAGEGYAHIAGLGSVCYAAMVLKQLGLRQCSLPFDWIFSSMRMVEHCIGDDFATLLDRSFYEVVPVAERPQPDEGFVRHRLYDFGWTGVSVIFNHYDPTVPARYAYLARCVDRWRRLLASGERTLFVTVFGTSDIEAVTPDFLRLAGRLDEAAPRTSLLAIGVLPPDALGGAFGISGVVQSGAHRMFAFRPFSLLHGLAFPDPFDDLFVRRFLAGQC